ncbi:MAG: hypothetical protein OXG35_01880, partial [Acidobacteria bacterium]|nr:hypothetical protein [Acidobacteriota bacterium]
MLDGPSRASGHRFGTQRPRPAAAGVRGRRRLLAAVLAGAGLAGAASPAAGQAASTVVVAPFTNVSRQPADEWIGAGIAETIAVDLQDAGLEVLTAGAGEPKRVGRRGAARGAPDPAATLDAYRRQGGAWLIDGALQRVGDALRVTTRIVDVETGGVEFGTRIDGAVSDLFDVQDEVAAVLAGRLSAARGGARAAARNPSTDPAARLAPGRRAGRPAPEAPNAPVASVVAAVPPSRAGMRPSAP